MDERGKSLPCHQFYPDEFAHTPATPAKLGQPDPNMFCKNWLENPFEEAISEETHVKKIFSCWEGNLGSTSQIYDSSGGVFDKFLDDVEPWHTMSCRDLLALADATIRKGSVDGDGGRSSGGGGIYKFLDDVESWHTMSCRDLLALADATIRKGSVNGDGGSSSDSGGGGGGGGGATETQPYGWLNLNNYLCDLNEPPQTLTEPPVSTGLSLQFTTVTTEKTRRAEHNQVASDTVMSNVDERRDLAADNKGGYDLDEQSKAGVSTLVEANQDFEKCRINFSQETHDKGGSSVPSPNGSHCSSSASFDKGELSSEIDRIKQLHEKTLAICRESLEAYLSVPSIRKNLIRKS